MLNRHLIRPVLLGLALASIISNVGAASSRLDGSAESPREEHCHDFAYPDLTCFSTEAERDADFTLAGSGEDLLTARGDGLVIVSSGYVIAYEYASYGGSSVVLSQDHGNLGSIGWADRISSYKVYTNLTGYFHEHTWFGGRVQSYCCYSHVSYVGNLLNNTFSSFDLP